MRTILALVALSASVFGQSYPSSIFTPLVAKDNVSTTLSSPMSALDTVAVVTSSTGWSANMLGYICDSSNSKNTCTGTFEVMRVTLVTGNVLTVSRTSPIAHAKNVTFSNNPVSAYNTSLTGEVLAIETALGPNLSNVPRASTVNPVTYNFATQSPAGTLSPGSNTITMVPVPLGVNGTDVGHRLYVSTTGTPEACIINGGSGIAGQASGQISINCANSHSAGWTIQSATYGASEACVANNPCYIEYPGGTFDWYGTFFPAANTGVHGGGQATTTLRWNNLNSKMFDIERDNFQLSGVRLLQVGTATAGSIGVYTAGAGSAVASAAADNGFLQDVRTVGFYNGLYLAGGGGVFNLNDVTSTNSVNDGIVVRQQQGFWSAVNSIFSGGNGITNAPSATTGGYSPFMTGIQTFGNGGWGVQSTIWLQISGTPSFFNNDRSGEIYVSLPSSAEVGWISDSYIQYAGVAVAGGLPWSTNTSAPGILVDTDSGPVSISNDHFFSTEGNCVSLKATFINVIDNRMVACGAGAQSGNIYGVLADSTHGYQIISGNYINAANRIDGIKNVIRNNVITVSSASPAIYLSSGTSIIFEGNLIEQVGAGTAYTIDAGVSLMDANNVVTVGSVTYNGQRADTSRQLNPFSPHSVGAAVASGATITPTGEFFHVTGTSAIATINPPFGFNGPYMCAIPDAIFTTNTAGNVGLASTAVVGRLLCWMYDGSKWWPSY